ncbi:MAG: EamA family transporter [Oligosphaeraceae bacterium]|nr:EamA family transporter [Oligosphaeraceae bacterium]
MAIIFAFSCLFFSALNDFVFKMFANRVRSRGTFVFLIGVCWLALTFWLPFSAENRILPTIFWGLISGFFSVAGNILLIEAMGMQSAGLCSTIYRLNLVLVVVGAVLLLGETLGPLQILGILSSLLAILAFMPGRDELHLRVNSRAVLGFQLVLIAAALRAGMGLSYKYAFTHGADKNMVTLINAGMWIAGGLLYALWREKKLAWRDRGVLTYGLLSGVLVTLIVFFMAGMLNHSDGAATIVLPIAQMSFLLTFALGAIFLGEKVSKRKIFALACGCLAIALLVLG